MTLRLAVMAALLTGLVACSFGNDVPVAEKAIGAFHTMLNAGKTAAIYQQSAPEMKSATSAEHFGKFLDAVHRKLGAFRGGKSVGWNDNVTPSGHFLSVNYAAHYDQGAADESFVYRIDQNRATLIGYHVSSDALIIN